MNISSILIAVNLPAMNETLQLLGQFDALEVYHTDENTGQVVAVLEAHTVDDEVAGLESIKALPNVLYAEMVCHYFESPTNIVEAVAPKLAEDTNCLVVK